MLESEIARILMDEMRFIKVKDLKENDIPMGQGLYAIRIENVELLPKEFAEILIERKHNILYIGISERNLRQRLWNEELHLEHPATFFRSLGAILGFRPPKDSLTSQNRNYTFTTTDMEQIIKWMRENLKVNYIECENSLHYIEVELIKKYSPLINIQSNPNKLKILQDLRKLCVKIARSR